MKKDDPEKGHRRSIRLRGYDYSRAGAYFITIATYDRKCMFGEVADGEMRVNALGEIARDEWFKTAVARRYVCLEENEFIVMPNHIHGIIRIVDEMARATHRVAPTGPPPGSISAVIGQFKSVAAKRINKLRGTQGNPVWQRNYYEHVIRNEDLLNRIRQYIRDNPTRWAMDRDNLQAVTPEPENAWRK